MGHLSPGLEHKAQSNMMLTVAGVGKGENP